MNKLVVYLIVRGKTYHEDGRIKKEDARLEVIQLAPGKQIVKKFDVEIPITVKSDRRGNPAVTVHYDEMLPEHKRHFHLLAACDEFDDSRVIDITICISNDTHNQVAYISSPQRGATRYLCIEFGPENLQPEV